MKFLNKTLPLGVMALTSLMTLGILPDEVIVSDTLPSKKVVQSQENIEVASLEGISLADATKTRNISQEIDELPTIDLPVVDIKIVNNIIQKINNVTIKSPSVGSIGVKGFKTVNLGTFKVKAYCGGKCCNQGEDAKGMKNYEGVNVAVDQSVIPYGTKLLIDGVGIRQTQPSNQKVTGQEIRVYVSNHNKVKEFGEKEIKILKVL